MKKGSLQEIASLKSYLWQYRFTYFLGFLCLFLSILFTMIIPKILMLAIDGIRISVAPEILLRYAGLIVLFALLHGFFKFQMRNILIGLSRKIEYLLRNDFFAHLQSLSPSFFGNKRTGDLMSRATNDLNAVRALLGPGIMYFIHTIVLFIADFCFMFTINVKLTLYILIPFPVVSFFILKFARKLHVRFKVVQEQFSIINTQVQENFSGIRVIKAYAKEEIMAKKFEQANETYLKKNMDLVKIWGFFHPLTSFVGGVFLVIILWTGGYQVIQGQITIGGLVAFMTYVGLLMLPSVMLGWVINLFQRGSASMGRINEIMQVMPEIKDIDNSNDISSLKGNIEFDHIDFCYTKGGPKVLHNINMRINPGEKIGLVGRTGSGKSTLVNLIPRLYDVTGGEIRMDGILLSHIPLKILRENIGYIPQETFIFSDSIKKNIGLGLIEENLDQVIEAAFFSHILDEIEEFPEKFDTMVGERGITLSGGQRQRLAISRALIRKPPVLIFDDVFSNVDLQTEHTIFQKVRPLMKGRTCIIITHRLSAVKDCDRIYVLDNGRIVEFGNHKQLIANEGFYANMYKKQLLIMELEEGK